MSKAKVIVGIDGSSAARGAMFWAAAEATRCEAELVLVHAGDVMAHDAPTEYGRSLLVEAQAALFEAGWGGPLSTRIEDVDPLQLLVECSRTARLVVVGAKGAGGTSSGLLGRTAHRVAAYAHCPVASIPDGWHEHEPPGPVVVGVSATHGAQVAIEYAFAEARARQTAIRAVRAWSRIDWTSDLADLMYKTEPAFETGQFDYLNRQLEPVRARYPDVPVHSIVSGGSIHEVLRRESVGGQLLVIGSRFADGHHAARLGPVTSRLLHTATGPTLVVGHLGHVERSQRAAAEEPSSHARI